jgi:hypothetical protein
VRAIQFPGHEQQKHRASLPIMPDQERLMRMSPNRSGRSVLS